MCRGEARRTVVCRARYVVTAGAIHFHERRLSKIRCAAVGKRRGRKQLSAMIPWLKRPRYWRWLSWISAPTTMASVWAIAAPRLLDAVLHLMA